MTKKADQTIGNYLGLDGEIEVGSIVRLISGGPSMTVEALNDSGTAHCVWFEKERVKERAFKVEILQKTTAEQLPVLILQEPPDDCKVQ